MQSSLAKLGVIGALVLTTAAISFAGVAVTLDYSRVNLPASTADVSGSVGYKATLSDAPDGANGAYLLKARYESRNAGSSIGVAPPQVLPLALARNTQTVKFNGVGEGGNWSYQCQYTLAGGGTATSLLGASITATYAQTVYSLRRWDNGLLKTPILFGNMFSHSYTLSATGSTPTDSFAVPTNFGSVLVSSGGGSLSDGETYQLEHSVDSSISWDGKNPTAGDKFQIAGNLELDLAIGGSRTE